MLICGKCGSTAIVTDHFQPVDEERGVFIGPTESCLRCVMCGNVSTSRKWGFKEVTEMACGGCGFMSTAREGLCNPCFTLSRGKDEAGREAAFADVKLARRLGLIKKGSTDWQQRLAAWQRKKDQEAERRDREIENQGAPETKGGGGETEDAPRETDVVKGGAPSAVPAVTPALADAMNGEIPEAVKRETQAKLDGTWKRPMPDTLKRPRTPYDVDMERARELATAIQEFVAAGALGPEVVEWCEELGELVTTYAGRPA